MGHAAGLATPGEIKPSSGQRRRFRSPAAGVASEAGYKT